MRKVAKLRRKLSAWVIVAILFLLALILISLNLTQTHLESASLTNSAQVRPTYMSNISTGKINIHPKSQSLSSTSVSSSTSTTQGVSSTTSTTSAPVVTSVPSTTSTSPTSSTSTSTTVNQGNVASEPMKDLGIQPATLTQSEWDSLLNLAQSAGVNVISFDLNWAAYEPNGPQPANEWTNLDAFVNDVISRHLMIRIQLVGMPDWARSAGEPSNSTAPWLAPSTPSELSSWSNFVSRVASHFGSKVTYYEIWNEENEQSFFSQGPNPSEYANLLEASYVSIKAAAPSAQVVFGGTSRNDVGFVSAVYSAINSQFPSLAVSDHHFFDILGVHPYSGDRAPNAVLSSWVYQDQWGTMDENYTGFILLHNLMAANGEGYKHIYITEFGYNTVAWNSFGPVSDSLRASYLTQAFSLAANTGYVDAISWYYFYPTAWNPSSWTLLQGSYPNWQQTQTFQALVNVPG